MPLLNLCREVRRHHLAPNENYWACRLTKGELVSRIVRLSLLVTFTWLDRKQNVTCKKAHQILEPVLEDHPCSGNHAAAVTAMCQPKGKEKQQKA